MKMGLQQADLWTVLSRLLQVCVEMAIITQFLYQNNSKTRPKVPPQFSQYDSSSILKDFHIICKIPSVEISTKVCL